MPEMGDDLWFEGFPVGRHTGHVLLPSPDTVWAAPLVSIASHLDQTENLPRGTVLNRMEVVALIDLELRAPELRGVKVPFLNLHSGCTSPVLEQKGRTFDFVEAAVQSEKTGESVEDWLWSWAAEREDSLFECWEPGSHDLEFRLSAESNPFSAAPLQWSSFFPYSWRQDARVAEEYGVSADEGWIYCGFLKSDDFAGNQITFYHPARRHTRHFLGI